jgi:hypothetical protein
VPRTLLPAAPLAYPPGHHLAIATAGHAAILAAVDAHRAEQATRRETLLLAARTAAAAVPQ